jgi:hypothetical protein
VAKKEEGFSARGWRLAEGHIYSGGRALSHNVLG